MRNRLDKWFPYLVVVPIFIHFSLFYLGPFLTNVVMSFMDWKVVGDSAFVGLANWSRLFKDPIFWQSLKNTVVFSLYYVVPVIALGLALAMIVNSRLKGAPLFQAIYFLPVVTSFVVIAGIWVWIFSPEPFGLVNQILAFFGIKPQMFLASRRQALPVLAGLSIFKVAGTAMVYYYGGLKDIPLELYEAGRIDGADGIKTFRYITWPLLKPTTLFVLIFITVGSFQVFDSIYLLTGGGPSNSTTTIVHQMYLHGFVFFNLGYAGTISIVLMLIILVLSLIQNLLVDYDY